MRDSATNVQPSQPEPENENNRGRNHQPGGVSQRPVGADPYRRGHRRARRDVLCGGAGDRTDPPDLRALPARQEPAGDRQAQSIFPEQLPRLQQRRRGNARGLGDRHRAMGHLRPAHRTADLPAARRRIARQGARVQHLRRLRVRALEADPGHRQFWSAGKSRQKETALRGSAGVPDGRRHAGEVAPGYGHHRHEDLAVRRGGGGLQRRLYRERRSEKSAEAVRADQESRRRQDGHPCRVPFDVAAACRDPHRRGAGTLRSVLVRRPDQDEQSRCASRLCTPHQRLGHRIGNARHPLGFPRAVPETGGLGVHARRRLVRRAVGIEKDRHHGRSVCAAGGAA